MLPIRFSNKRQRQLIHNTETVKKIEINFKVPSVQYRQSWSAFAVLNSLDIYEIAI